MERCQQPCSCCALNSPATPTNQMRYFLVTETTAAAIDATAAITVHTDAGGHTQAAKWSPLNAWLSVDGDDDSRPTFLMRDVPVPLHAQPMAHVKKQLYEPLFAPRGEQPPHRHVVIVEPPCDSPDAATVGQTLVLLDVCARDRISTLTGCGQSAVVVDGGVVTTTTIAAAGAAVASSSGHGGDVKVGNRGGDVPRTHEIVTMLLPGLRPELHDALVAFASRFADAAARDALLLEPPRPTIAAIRALTAGSPLREVDLEARVKPWPSPAEGLAVFEFFRYALVDIMTPLVLSHPPLHPGAVSGIGGMRLALPDAVRGVPVRHITAFDISATANAVYACNFDRAEPFPSPAPHHHQPPPPPPRHVFGPDNQLAEEGLGPSHAHGRVSAKLIEGLRLGEADGEADIWTMSPPCQVRGN